nr:EOG090X03YR [Macrothrix elegans]
MEPSEALDEVIARGERWAPLGAAEPEEAPNSFDVDDQDYWHSFACYDSEKLQLLEEEQEQLNSSLMALTSHFAQVQFRLKQIVDADPETKETLLRELEEFAFRGIPDFQKSIRCVESAKNIEEVNSQQDHATKMESHKVKQHKLISQLKQQLEDLERYAYETGEAGLPQNLLVERQKIIIDQMKNKLQLNVDDLDKYSVEELKQQVDHAIGQLVNPLKMKEQLVSQLKTQVSDLERFIEFLQGPAEKKTSCKCTSSFSCRLLERNEAEARNLSTAKPLQLGGNNESIHQTLKRMANLLQLYVVSQFGCGIGHNFPKPMPTQEKNHQLSEALNRLNVAVQNVILIATARGHASTREESDNRISITKAVRKGLCPALRDLLFHGFVQPSTSTSMVPFLSCTVAHASTTTRNPYATPHPWQLFVAFYLAKDGNSIMTNPQRSLAQSFSLEIQGGTSKQSLLVAIGNIIAMHKPYKRGPEAHFKAFLSSALNAKKIVPWLRIILRNPTLIEEFYEPCAFVMQPVAPSVNGQVMDGLCQPIAIPMCQLMPYNATRMPNLLGMEDQDEALVAIEQFRFLPDTGCSPYLRSLLDSRSNSATKSAAIRGKIEWTETFGTLTLTNIEVVDVFKKGQIRIHPFSREVLWTNTSCGTCPRLDLGREYFLLGHEDVSRNRLLYTHLSVGLEWRKKYALLITKWEKANEETLNTGRN